MINIILIDWTREWIEQTKSYKKKETAENNGFDTSSDLVVFVLVNCFISFWYCLIIIICHVFRELLHYCIYYYRMLYILLHILYVLFYNSIISYYANISIAKILFKGSLMLFIVYEDLRATLLFNCTLYIF